jgi:hypothetical protein
LASICHDAAFAITILMLFIFASAAELSAPYSFLIAAFRFSYFRRRWLMIEICRRHYDAITPLSRRDIFFVFADCWLIFSYASYCRLPVRHAARHLRHAATPFSLA